MTIKNLEEEKTKLKAVTNNSHHNVGVAIAAVKDLAEELETTNSTLAKDDTNDN